MESVSKMLDWIGDQLVGPGSIDTFAYAQIREMAHEIEAEVESEYMRLPLDADGEPVHIGDRLDPPHDCNDYFPMVVTRLTYDSYEQEWFCDGEPGGFTGMVGEHMDVAGWTHHRKPTIEDVLREFVEVERVYTNKTYAKYADKLREVMGDE